MTGEKELFVQDDRHTVYLINDVGRVLWKLPLGQQINSEVYQVDLFKNGKLQYLFSTPDKMYLIDRNGMQRGVSPSLSKESASREYPCTIMIITATTASLFLVKTGKYICTVWMENR